MKTSINILLLTVALLGVQACTSKSEKEEAAEAASLAASKTPDATTNVPTLEERRAAAEKKRVALAEKRRLALEERLKASVTYKDQKGNLVYNKAEVDPSFEGGDGAMNLFLHDNVKFPETAAKEGLDGTVYVDFVVTSSGNVVEVQATSIPGEDVDQRFVDEALRVVKSMPKWIPGRQRGKAVAVSFSIPITFQIEG